MNTKKPDDVVFTLVFTREDIEGAVDDALGTCKSKVDRELLTDKVIKELCELREEFECEVLSVIQHEARYQLNFGE